VEQDGQWAVTGLIQEKSFLGTEQLTDKFTALGHQITWIESTSGEKVAHRPVSFGSLSAEKGSKKASRKVDLTPMTEDEFKAYLPHAIDTYAEDLEKSGVYSKLAARNKATNDFRENLPSGIYSKGHFLTRILDVESGEKIGILYYIQEGPKSAFIYDFEIVEAKRGGGYGKASMLKLEEKLKGEGFSKISLHVFNHAEVAVGLYKKLGYSKVRDSRMGGMFMEKQL
jgi:ribosomal protein S18 acetylase RimI-like enzyme